MGSDELERWLLQEAVMLRFLHEREQARADQQRHADALKQAEELVREAAGRAR